jgi:N-acetyl-gamma-glutamyl-phosphate reductase
VGFRRPLATTIASEISQPAATRRKSWQALRVAVLGATGYAGGELLTLLARHPRVRVTALMSSGRDGKKAFPIEHSHPSLRGRFAVPCSALDLVDLAAAEPEVAFLALPHETSLHVVPALLASGVRVVDLSGAFRLKDAHAYPRWYGFEHQAPEALGEAVYAIPELVAGALAKARLVANPGCYATSVVLGLAPLLQAGWVDISRGIIVDSKSGASGAGRSPSDRLHFAEVNENFRAYSLFHHRHVPEMLQALELKEADFTFTPHLLPITRGILSTIYIRLARRAEQEEVEALFRDFYSQAPLVRVYTGGTLPEIAAIAHTPYADLGFALDAEGERLIVVSALDNLGKGAASQAIQNMNLMFGFPQETGLL